MNMMHAFCSDLEGVWIPEIWINVAEKTGIDELKLTTRDIKDYDELMNYRLKILKERGLKLQDIQKVISTINPFDGAIEMIKWLKKHTRFVIVSDTFIEFAQPILEKLEWPLLFCHTLNIDYEGNIIGYQLRQKDAKRKVIQALRGLNFYVVSCGDSYNDIGMLQESDEGILFKPPQNVIHDYPHFNVIDNYYDLKSYLSKILNIKE